MGHFIEITSGGVPLFFYFWHLGGNTQHRGAGRRSADANLMFEGIGSNSQQAERSELSGHRHCLPICIYSQGEKAYFKKTMRRRQKEFLKKQIIKDILNK